ncbi:glycosyltransferase family 1 protein [Desulfonema ishimotonii]|uniref:Glycosyltransferase family 1 protein n=1 Tax=Desulfonema ishimotonii TaxID=45657 RepID=A0A401FXD6_9BACT|nr:glycosyltransferase family 4 protein [Desulfonema ishimotonii]GBC61630.1 glycosyltransferase family 1 protein [Desulfonema ishimotonii]
MKIALICKAYSVTKGGLERYTVRLSRTLRDAGHDVHLFSNTRQPEPGIRFHHVPMIPHSSPGKNLSFAWRSRQALLKERFDVIQSMERVWNQDIFRASDGINPIQMRERYASPAVRKLKAIGPRRQVLTWLERRIFERGGCRFVMTNSHLVKHQILRHYQADPDRIAVIYNSVSHEKFHPGLREIHRRAIREAHGVADNEILLLFAGNDFRRKGLGLVIDALARCDSKKFRLMVAGSDKKGPYERQAERNGLASRVLFIGPRREIEHYYAASDVMVLPTRYDAFSNVCLEAMACGIPVITSRTNGASEIVRNGDNGYVLETTDPGELAGRLSRFADPGQRIRMGENAAATARPFTSERYMSELMALYDRVIRDKQNS